MNIGRTEAGRKVLNAADGRRIYVDFSDKLPPEGVYGFSKGPIAHVYTRNTEVGRNYDLLGLRVDGLQQTANIGFHEGLHSLGVRGSRRAEALVRLEELRSIGVPIDRQAMRQVLSDMQGNYDQLAWRAGRSSPSFPSFIF